MTIPLWLEWFFKGQWQRIGWEAETEQSKEDLREHGRKLSLHGGFYRLTQPSIYQDAPVTVVHEYPHHEGVTA